jgi:hypothetical protein
MAKSKNRLSRLHPINLQENVGVGRGADTTVSVLDPAIRIGRAENDHYRLIASFNLQVKIYAFEKGYINIIPGTSRKLTGHLGTERNTRNSSTLSRFAICPITTRNMKSNHLGAELLNSTLRKKLQIPGTSTLESQKSWSRLAERGCACPVKLQTKIRGTGYKKLEKRPFF